LAKTSLQLQQRVRQIQTSIKLHAPTKGCRRGSIAAVAAATLQHVRETRSNSEDFLMQSLWQKPIQE